MADFMDLNTISQDTAFQGRCIYALKVAAMSVSDGTLQGVNSAQAATYAANVLNVLNAINGQQIALAVLTNPTIAAEATTASGPGCPAVPDGDIQFAVDTMFNALAGITT